MNRAKKLLAAVAGRLDLPAEVVAGLPKMELTGNQEFSMEHHRGLLEYADQQIAIGSSAGTVRLYGKGLVIKLMNQERITVSGTIQTVELEESQHE